jgi:hypothetical protein
MTTKQYSVTCFSGGSTWVDNITMFKHCDVRIANKKKLRLVESKKRLEQLKKPDEVPGTRVASKGVTSELAVSTIVPTIYDGNGRDEVNFAGADPNEWMSCTSPSVGSTVIDVKNYTNMLIDPTYTTVVHDVVKGKMYEWRKRTLEFLEDLVVKHAYPRKAIKTQKKFAGLDLVKVMRGLNNFKTIAVNVMSEKAIMKYVPGVEDEEMAHFVYSMACCNSFGISIYRHDVEKNASVLTVFDDAVDDKFAYGKHSVENLTGLVNQKPVPNPYLVKQGKSIEIIEVKSGDNDEIDVKVVKKENLTSV